MVPPPSAAPGRRLFTWAVLAALALAVVAVGAHPFDASDRRRRAALSALLQRSNQHGGSRTADDDGLGDGGGRGRHRRATCEEAGMRSVTLQLKWLFQGQFSGYVVAQSMGFYRDECLSPFLRSGGAHVVPADEVLVGRAHFGIDSFLAAPQARTEGRNVTVVAQMFERSGLRSVSFKERGIASLADFRNKTVCTWLFGDETPLRSALAAAGLRWDPDPTGEWDPATADFNVLMQGSSLKPLLDGTCDTASAMYYNEFATLLELRDEDTGDFLYTEDEFNVFAFEGHGLEDAIVANSAWLEDPVNQETTERFLRATFRGWMFARDFPEEALALLADTGYHQRWMLHAANALTWPRDGGRTVGQVDAAVAQAIIDTNVQHGVLSRSVRLSEVFDDSYALAAVADMPALIEAGDLDPANYVAHNPSGAGWEATLFRHCTALTSGGGGSPLTFLAPATSACPAEDAAGDDDGTDVVSVVVPVVVVLVVMVLFSFVFSTVYKRKKQAMVAVVLEKMKAERTEILESIESGNELSKALQAVHRLIHTDNPDVRPFANDLTLLLDAVLASNDSKIYAPDIDADQNYKDHETNQYLHQILNQQTGRKASVQQKGSGSGSQRSLGRTFLTSERGVARNSNVGADDHGPMRNESIDLSALQGAGPRLSAALNRSELRLPPQLPSADNEELVHELLAESLGNWNFDIFRLSEFSGEHALFYMIYYTFQNYGLLELLGVDETVLLGWAFLMEQNYKSNNPYHTAVHAADVLHAASYILFKSDVSDWIDDAEMLALLIAAVVHDLGHGGRTNAFLIGSNHPLAILYNDRAVLESHHLALSFKLTLAEPHHNIFANTMDTLYPRVRRLVIDLVLATDVSQHFIYLKKFNTMKALGQLDTEMDDNRLLLLQLIIKCSDVSNPCKTQSLSHEWTRRIMEEFALQGDAEKARGMPVSMFMDRDTTNIPKCQAGFVDFIVSPLYTAFDGFSPLPEPMTYLQENRAYWKSKQALLDFPPPVRVLNSEDGSVDSAS